MSDKPETFDVFPNEMKMEEYLYSNPIYHMAWSWQGQMIMLCNDAETLLEKSMRKSFHEAQIKTENEAGFETPPVEKMRAEDFHLTFQG